MSNVKNTLNLSNIQTTLEHKYLINRENIPKILDNPFQNKLLYNIEAKSSRITHAEYDIWMIGIMWHEE